MPIATAHGAHELADRIGLGVSKACGRYGDIRDLPSTGQCRTELLDNAAAQLSADGYALAARDVAARV